MSSHLSLLHVCNRDKIWKVEELQKRAIRCDIVYNTHTTYGVLDRAEVNTLYVKRIRTMLCFVRKIVNNKEPMYMYHVIRNFSKDKIDQMLGREVFNGSTK